MGGVVSGNYGLEKFSHLEDKIYRTIEQIKRERQQRETLERELASLRSQVDGEDRGWVRFVDTVTGDATPPARFPVWEGEWFNVVDAWHPDGGQYAGYWCDDNACAKPGTVTIVDAVTGRPLRSTQDLLGSRGDIG